MSKDDRDYVELGPLPAPRYDATPVHYAHCALTGAGASMGVTYPALFTAEQMREYARAEVLKDREQLREARRRMILAGVKPLDSFPPWPEGVPEVSGKA